MIEAVSAGDGAERQAKPGIAWPRSKRKSGLGREQIAETDIAALTAVPSGGADSPHRLCQGPAPGINRLAAQCAEEIVAGAHVHGLPAGDRPKVEAFMRGVDRTARSS